MALLLLIMSVSAAVQVANHAADIHHQICHNHCEAPEIHESHVKKTDCKLKCESDFRQVQAGCRAGRPQRAPNGAAMCSDEGAQGAADVRGTSLELQHHSCISECHRKYVDVPLRERTICHLTCDLDKERDFQYCMSHHPNDEAKLCVGEPSPQTAAQAPKPKNAAPTPSPRALLLIGILLSQMN